MNFKIKKEHLMKHLNYVIRGVSNKNLRPILNCIKFELTYEGLYLISSDNDITIKTFIDKDLIEPEYMVGELVVFGRYIYDIVRKLPNEIIIFEEVMDNKLFISTTNSSFTLNCNNVNDFPNFELENQKNPIELNTKILKNIINQTSFAASTQESRPVLTGINFKIKDNILECIATDSYRLARKKIELNDKIDNEINIIIPTKNLIELTKLFDEEIENLQIHIFPNKIIFKFGTIVMMSRLINGNYPDVLKLITEEFLIKFIVNCSNFYDLLDRVSLLSSEEENHTIKLESKDQTMTVYSNIPEIGHVEEKMEIQKEEENDIKIAFSSKYMMDAIKTLDCEQVGLLFNGEFKPIIIKNNDDDSLLHIILPIKTY